MWLLPSRGRPHNITRLIAAYDKTGATTPVWLRLDEDDPMLHGYDLSFPDSWDVCIGKRMPLSGYYNEAPMDLDWYGFIADDVVPGTDYWDQILIEAAGTNGMAVPLGGHEDTDIAPHFVLGGDLVRETGWVCLPGLDRIYIDTVWNDIAKKRNVLRYLPEVMLEHRHFSNKKALFDKIYRKNNNLQDKIIYENWRKEYDYTS